MGGGKMLEAPITGGLEALKKGQMTVFMAGDEAVAEEYRPLLDDIYQKVIYTGKMGTALIPKVLSNMLTCVHNIAMGEVFMIAKKSGLDLRAFWDCIRASAGNSFVWETGGPMLMQGTYDPSSPLPCRARTTSWDTKSQRNTGFLWRCLASLSKCTTKLNTSMEMMHHATQTPACWRKLLDKI